MSGFNLQQFWDAQAGEHMDVAAQTFAALRGDFEKLLDLCAGSIAAGGKILLFGNGGSAADAQHIATELTVRYVKNRKAIAGLALTTDTSALTAIGNDLGFDEIFARQVEALGRSGDVALGISTSGTSGNVLRGLKAARGAGLNTCGLTGKSGGQMGGYCDVLLKVPSATTARIQEMHITLGQMLCGALEGKLGLL
ncbi:MAG: D-sedoheptulose 7-phosphate isomerase [Alphaproteobacteria bacterium]